MNPQGILKIGIPESIMIYRLYEVIIEYKTKYPNVEIIRSCKVSKSLFAVGVLAYYTLTQQKLQKY